MQRVIIEDGLSLYKKTGIGRYSLLLEYLLKDMGYDVEMKRKPFLERINNSILKRCLYVLWLNTIFVLKLFFSKTEIIVFPNTITPIIKIPKKKYYPVVHDLWAYKFPETVTKSQAIYTSFVLFSMRKNYTKILTVSNTVREELLDFFKCDENDVKVVYSYFSFGEKPQVLDKQQEKDKIFRKYGINEKKYILSVATLNKRKNIPMLINAFSKIETDYKLVLVGSASSETFSNTNKNIIFTGYISDEELKILYKYAKLYVFPSIYEGMGLPTIDAQSLGVPVLCSNIPVFHEIGCDSVIYFDLNIESLKKNLELIISNDLMQQQLINKGYENIKRFSIDKIKEQLCFILKE